MKFRGLPEDMSIGSIDVRPMSKLTLPLLPCGFCDFFNCEYFTCEEGHVTCIECGTDEFHRTGANRLQSSCYGCGSRVTFRRTRICSSHLVHEKFICPCGFMGTLNDLKVHLEEPRKLTHCVLQDKNPQEMKLFSFKKCLLDLQEFRVALDHIDNYIGSFFDIRLPKPDPLLHEHIENNDYIFGLEEKLKSIEELAADVASLNTEMRPTMEVLFRPDNLLILPRERLPVEVCSNVIVDGITLKIRFIENEIDGKTWLGFFMRGSAHEPPPEASKRSGIYPLKARVIVRIHDTKGHEFNKVVLKTFENNKYTSLSFMDPTAEEAVFVGVEQFVLKEDITESKIVRNDHVYISMMFESLF